MVRRRVVEPVRPADLASHSGLAYALWLPEREPSGGVVVLHGADSCKESHYDFCRALVASGLAAIAFDARGHGESGGSLDGRAVEDVAVMAGLLRERLPAGARVALRGSSMGGYLAIVAAEASRADAVVAICPASGEGLRRGLRAGRFSFAVDVAALTALLGEHDLERAVGGLRAPLLIMHAEGDEVVPVEASRRLAARFADPRCRLIIVPGGHHRSVQHDEELQATALRWLRRALAG